MEADERTRLLMIAMKASAFLEKIDNLTTEEFSKGGEHREREALRTVLTGIPHGPCQQCDEA